MFDCLNSDDDDEEAHRAFFSSFYKDALHVSRRSGLHDPQTGALPVSGYYGLQDSCSRNDLQELVPDVP